MKLIILKLIIENYLFWNTFFVCEMILWEKYRRFNIYILTTFLNQNTMSNKVNHIKINNRKTIYFEIPFFMWNDFMGKYKRLK